ncbi:hypothetical protein NKG94_46895 [Micromonospora sp. M12]
MIDSATLADGDGHRKGRVFLLYHPGTGTNCVVTLKDTAVGTKSAASAYLEVQGRTRSTDSGSFDYYAGPVRANAAGTCVKWAVPPVGQLRQRLRTLRLITGRHRADRLDGVRSGWPARSMCWRAVYLRGIFIPLRYTARDRITRRR